MRVLAVTKPLRQFPGKAAVARCLDIDSRRHPVRHRRIIGRRAGKGRLRQPLTKLQPAGPVIRLHLAQERLVVRRIGDHGDKTAVLGRRPDHGGPADIDILDTGPIIAALGQRLLERIEVHDQQIDRFDPMGGHGHQMLVIVAQRQKPAVDRRMQGLDPPIHHLRISGHLGHIAHLQPRHAQHPRRAAGRDQLDPHRGQRAGQFQQPALVRDRDQCAANGNQICHAGLLALARWGSASLLSLDP